jgi:hypothetical protein
MYRDNTVVVLENGRMLVLGCAYLENSDGVRASPSAVLVEALYVGRAAGTFGAARGGRWVGCICWMFKSDRLAL